MALKPEFIGVLRDIRDRMYPEIKIASTQMNVMFPQVEIWHTEVEEDRVYVESVADQILNLTIGTVTTVPVNPDGTSGTADVVLDNELNELSFDIPTGPRGLIGVTGAVGAQGAQGIKGDTGSTGPKGDTGAQGNTGVDGVQGVQGLTGPAGETGATGASGIGIDIQGTDTVSSIKTKPSTTVGEAWIASDTGLDDDGLSVLVSDVLRATGSKWINIGPIKGDKGDIGLTGETGIQGPSGTQGIQGIQGIQGTQGLQGDKGDTGEQGIQGPEGLQGEQGFTGSTGAKGDTGATGATGEQGQGVPVGVFPADEDKIVVIKESGNVLEDMPAYVLSEDNVSTGAKRIITMVSITQAEYDAITIKDADTYYAILEV